MRTETQTILAGRDDGIPGNCVQAVVASLLDMQIEAVPHFVLFNDWRAALRLWLEGIGYEWECYAPGAVIRGPYIALGTSPRGYGHVCVAEDGEVVWDPHPSRDGLADIDEVWIISHRKDER